MANANQRHLEAIRSDYLQRVHQLAERLRPAFEAGELRGELEQGWAKGDEVGATGAEIIEAFERSPAGRLNAICERALVKSDPEAYLVLASSPSEPKIDGDIELADVRHAAAECVRRDLLRIARSRGWYTPEANESPSNDELPEEQVLAVCGSAS